MTWFLHWSTSSKTSLPPAGKDSAEARSSGRGLLGGFSVVCLVFAVVQLPVACFGTLAFSLLSRCIEGISRCRVFL